MVVAIEGIKEEAFLPLNAKGPPREPDVPRPWKAL
jgi:hypothetical protein